jgi:transposase-like protein
MSRKPRVTRTPEEKWQIIQEGMKSGNVSETCRRHGIAPNLFYRWKDEAEQGAKAMASSVHTLYVQARLHLGGKALPRRKPRRTIASGNWNAHWGGSRWRSKS